MQKHATIKTLLVSLAAAPLALTAALAADPVEIDVSGEVSVVSGLSDGEFKADGDAEIRVKGSTVLDNGIELGGVLEGRVDGQQPQSIYAGGRYTSLLIGGPRGVGPGNSDVFLQGAYAYARGGFGELIIGRDHGVARTLAVRAPTIFSAYNVNDWRTDFTGMNDVHTVNDFTGYSTKVSYLPPANFLGGMLGGFRMGVSYSPRLSTCADDLCAPVSGLLVTDEGILLSEDSIWDNAFEAALYYQKDIRVSASEGLRIGLGASFVTANENAIVNSPVFDDYNALALGLNLGYRGITIGGSVKATNSGLAEADGDNYFAFDAGVTFQTGEEEGDWGFMLGYGRSEADMIGPNLLSPTFFQDTQTAQAGVTYYVAPGITVGAAAQFTDATRPAVAGGDEEATSVVIESSIKF